jgi:hypothetical protein
MAGGIVKEKIKRLLQKKSRLAMKLNGISIL